MVIDKIENTRLYKTLSPAIARALDYISSTDFSTVDTGRYELDDGRIFALVSEYETVDPEKGKLEGHRKYIDVQYMAKGKELVGYIHFSGQIPVEAYSPEKDRAFFKEATSFIRFPEKSFVIFWPDDLHMPNIKDGAAEMVKKVVVKVSVDLL